jgi:4'-phosphopantetheinyl transferase
MVACAIASHGQVGIDLERIDMTFDFRAVASRFFTVEELDQIERCSPSQRSTRFVELWTLKEAYVKAIGRGVSQDLSDLRFHIDGDLIHFTAPGSVDTEQWRFAVFAPGPLYRMAVAVRPTEALVSDFIATTPDDSSKALVIAASAVNLS